MQDFATATAEATLGAASLIDKLQEKLSPGNFNFLGLIPVIGGYIGPGGVLDKLRQEGRKLSAETMGAPGAISGKFPVGAQYFALQEKADAAAIKRQKELAAIERKRLDNLRKIAADAAKKLALDKASAFLNKANQIFDMDRIQLAAAAMAKQTEEDRVRIRLKTEIMDLEEAISEGNVQGAAKFAALITQDAALLGQLRDSAYNLSDVPNPFDAWLNSLNAALAALLALATVVPAVTAMVGMGGFNAGSARMGESAGNAAAGLPANSLTDFMGFGDEHLGALGRQGAVQNINVVVNNAGSTITERDLVDAITQGIYNNQASGIPINYSTVY
jgi:hypothetical protein